MSFLPVGPEWWTHSFNQNNHKKIGTFSLWWFQHMDDQGHQIVIEIRFFGQQKRIERE
jgi:hypothetical protein